MDITLLDKYLYKQYKRKGFSELTPWVEGFDMTNVSISIADQLNGSPKEGDMIARNPKNHEDKWLIAKKYFEDNLELVEDTMLEKTLVNTDTNSARKNVKDIVFWGNGDTFKLISKASSVAEGWMKSTKALELSHGVVLQVTTQQKNPDGSYAIAEAVTWIPGAEIKTNFDPNDKVIGRELITAYR